MADTILTQVRFSMKTPEGIEFNDALYYTEDEWTALKGDDKAVEAAKTARFDAWVAAVKNPPPPVEPTKEELQARKAVIQAELADIQAKIAAVDKGGK